MTCCDKCKREIPSNYIIKVAASTCDEMNNYSYKTYDLCKECFNEFNKFIKPYDDEDQEVIKLEVT